MSDKQTRLLGKKFIIGFVLGIVAMFMFTVAALYFIPLFYAPYARKQAVKRLKPPPVPLEKASYDWRIQTPEGEEVSITEFKDRTVLLQFWNPACLTCKTELPSLQRLYDSSIDDDITFVFISVEKNAEELLQTADETGLTMPLYMVLDKRPDMFKIRDIPATFVIDSNGNVAYRYFGSAKWDDEGFASFLRGLTAKDT